MTAFPERENPVFVFFGPTASGKSALAMRFAHVVGAEIINADAIQCYEDLRVLSARPTQKDEADIPHHLYGFLKGDQPISAWGWSQKAHQKTSDVFASGLRPVICGGSGFYLQSYMEGLADIPAIPEDIRKTVRRVQSDGLTALSAKLHERHPEENALLYKDPQRAARALEVSIATGKPLSYWQKKAQHFSCNRGRFFKCLILPSREKIYENCNQRFAKMIKEGAIEEMYALRKKNPRPSWPVMKAHGVGELLQWMDKKISLDDAKEKAAQATRNYAKRQMTWIRQHYKADLVITEPAKKNIEQLILEESKKIT